MKLQTYDFFLSEDGVAKPVFFEADLEGVLPPLDLTFGVLLKKDKIDFYFFSLITNYSLIRS